MVAAPSTPPTSACGQRSHHRAASRLLQLTSTQDRRGQRLHRERLRYAAADRRRGPGRPDQLSATRDARTGYTVSSSSQHLHRRHPRRHVLGQRARDRRLDLRRQRRAVDQRQGPGARRPPPTAPGRMRLRHRAGRRTAGPANSRTSRSTLSAVSDGTAPGSSLKTYGIDIDKIGVMTFDAAFAAAYAADPAGTQTAIAGRSPTRSDDRPTEPRSPRTTGTSRRSLVVATDPGAPGSTPRSTTGRPADHDPERPCSEVQPRWRPRWRSCSRSRPT